MAGTEKKKFEVVMTGPAISRFYEILDYFYEHYSLTKAEVISNEIRDLISSLTTYPNRGAIEPRLIDRKFTYRFLLYNWSKRADIKIIYYVSE